MSEFSAENVNRRCLQKLSEMGCQGYQVSSQSINFDEISYDSGRFSMLRSGQTGSLSVKALHDSRLGVSSGNDLGEEQIIETCENAFRLSQAATPDDGHALASEPISQDFSSGPEEADRDAMFDLVSKFAKQCEEFTDVNIRNIFMRFQSVDSVSSNSHDVVGRAKKGYYSISVICNGFRDGKAGSMNYEQCSFTDFSVDLMDYFRPLLISSSEQIDASKSSEGKFEGDIILTPKCAAGFLASLLEHLETSRLVPKTSRLLGKIGESIVSDKMTLSSKPRDFAIPVFFTGDLIETRNIDIFDRGRLKTYLLDLYGANKSKLAEPSNFAQRLIVPSGEKSLEEITRSVSKGILVDRFSGGRPNANGDFSGIAKNSYLISGGETVQPLSETMISGNLFEMFQNVREISREARDDGQSRLPWICASGIRVS